MNNIHWLVQGELRVGAYRAGSDEIPAVPLSPLRMLVVDDIDTHRAILTGMLNLLFRNVTVDEAADGLQAQAKLRNQRYDIILSDWLMPNMDGIELAAWLHGGEVTPLPYVLISSRDDPDEIAALFTIPGIDGYLIKPLDHTAMRAVIAAALAHPEPVSRAA